MGEKAEKLAKAHWEYLDSVLMAHAVSSHERELCGHHYRTAFVHGFKHGVESIQGDQHEQRADSRDGLGTDVDRP